MLRSRLAGSVILGVVAITFGCSGGGAKADDKMIKEQIAIMEKIADVYEKVTDKKSFDEAQLEFTALNGKLASLDEKLLAAGAERKQAAQNANRIQYDAAVARMALARKRADKAAHPMP